MDRKISVKMELVEGDWARRVSAEMVFPADAPDDHIHVDGSAPASHDSVTVLLAALMSFVEPCHHEEYLKQLIAAVDAWRAENDLPLLKMEIIY